MSEPIDIVALIPRIRSGDKDASAELVHRFEPFIQRVVRLRMGQPGHRGALGREAGTSDICQSVFRSLLRGLMEHRYQLDKPGDLERLLQVMVRFNVATKARRSSVRRRQLVEDFEQVGWIDSAPRPDQEVAEQNLLDAILERFSEEELELVTLWLDDMPLADIGQRIGCTPDAVRMRLKRAFVRVRNEMTSEKSTDA